MWIALAVAVGVVAVGLATVHAIRPRRWLMWASLGGLAATVAVCGLMMVVGFLGAGGRNVDPAQKATRLAEGMSLAMNGTGIWCVAMMLWSPGFLIGELRRRRVRRVS